jgi:hypothetical protein
MVNCLSSGAKISPPSLCALIGRHHFIDSLTPRSLLSAMLKMEQKIYRRISENICKTLQEHNQASLERARIQFTKKYQSLLERMQPSRTEPTGVLKNVSQLN